MPACGNALASSGCHRFQDHFMQTGRVSVVIPLYNHARYIAEAVASVLEWMSRGPAGAHVTGREVAEAAPAAGDTGFAVRRDG